VHPHQLFVGGVRQTRARTPNAGRFLSIDTILGNSTASTGLVLAGSAPVAVPKLASAVGVEAVVFASYFTQRYAVGSLSSDAAGSTLLRFPTAIIPPKCESTNNLTFACDFNVILSESSLRDCL